VISNPIVGHLCIQEAISRESTQTLAFD